MNFVRARRTAGLSLMLSSLLVGLLMAPSAVAAEPEVPEGAEEVEITRQAFWQANRAKFADNAATSQFPPQAVCLVAPNACFFPEGDGDPSGDLELGTKANEETAELSKEEQELLATMAEADGGDPAAPVEEGDHPVSIAFGEANYRSAIEFELPPLPDGEMVSSFTMVLTEGDPTYANESPAFRQAVLAALTCARENPDGFPVQEEELPVEHEDLQIPTELQRCTIEEFEKIPSEDLTDGKHLLVEVCPITTDWEEGRAQSESDLPEVDCLFTAAGQPVTVEVDGEDEVLWVFDLTFAAQAWYDGSLEQKGLLLAAGAAENLAYGDEEQTYSKQVTFDQPVQIAMTTEPEPEPLAPPPPPPAPPTGSFSGGGSGSSDVFATPPSSSSDEFVPPPSTSSEPMDQAPAVSEPTEAAPAETEERPTLAAGTPLGEPETPWWSWLLVPMFLAGAWLMSRSLAEQAAVATSHRSGAMTRLLERRATASPDTLVTG